MYRSSSTIYFTSFLNFQRLSLTKVKPSLIYLVAHVTYCSSEAHSTSRSAAARFSLRPLFPQNPTRNLEPSHRPHRCSAAGDGGHRGRAWTCRFFRWRSASRAPPPPFHCRRQAQAQVVQARADAARCPDPRHAGTAIRRSSYDMPRCVVSCLI